MFKRYLMPFLVILLLIGFGLVYFYTTAGSAYAADLFTGWGNKARQDGKNAQAMSHYRRALKLNELDAEARTALSEIMLGLGQSDEAEALLLESIRLLPGSPQFYLRLAALYTGIGRFDEAVAIMDSPTSPYVNLSLRGKRPAVHASPEPGVLGKPGVFSISQQPGLTYYYADQLSNTPDLWLRFQTDIPLTGGNYRFKVIAVSREGVPSRLMEYSYTLLDSARTVFSSFDALDDYLEERVKALVEEELRARLPAATEEELPAN